MKQLLRLCQQEEKKLGQLGQQRSEAQNRIDSLSQQKQLLSQMVKEYTELSCNALSPITLQNSAQMIETIAPMQKQLTRKQLLLQQEHQRMDNLWRQQLGRQQGIKWLYQERKQQQRAQLERQEQKQQDDFASRYALS
ncbi:Conserved hypothetical protein [Shewanella piezotolerans WP3]|uniref:Flagellar FliJ protein n=1 Tax=Shewanella piezotolerans (strain WP3 / JCM 13877) TaxID=225849 RepID=B8CVN5_SHEPW|nr:flagellar FliJ family protein [Shewanella piezotolerans]ACJ31711.1 Conserved hypothetical protein [Shewanella piezotolerans WP3]